MVVAAGTRAPTAVSVTAVLPRGKASPITLQASDPDGGSLSFSLAQLPVHGKLGGQAPNLTYTPDAGFVGLDAFTFTASDGKDTSAAATAMVTVTGSTSKATVKVAKVAKTRLVCRTRSGKRVCVRR